MTQQHPSQTELYGAILTNEQQYTVDLSRLSDDQTDILLTREQEQEYMDRAREGDRDAKNTLLLHLLPHIKRMASHFYHTARALDGESRRIEYLDLIQEGNEELLLKWDKALSKENPCAFLMGCVKFRMRDYGRVYESLIITPGHGSHFSIPVSSIDTPITDDGLLLADCLEEGTPISPTYTDEQLVGLHEVIQTALAPKQRNRIIRLYGLYEHAPQTMAEIARIDQVPHSNIWKQQQSALQRLRDILASPVASCDVYTREEVSQVLGIKKSSVAPVVVRYHGIHPCARGLYPKDQIDALAERQGKNLAASPVAACEVYTREEVSQVLEIKKSSIAPVVVRYHGIHPCAHGLYPKDQIDALAERQGKNRIASAS